MPLDRERIRSNLGILDGHSYSSMYNKHLAGLKGQWPTTSMIKRSKPVQRGKVHRENHKNKTI
jgi:hypothetical protein